MITQEVSAVIFMGYDYQMFGAPVAQEQGDITQGGKGAGKARSTEAAQTSVSNAVFAVRRGVGRSLSPIMAVD